MGVPDIYLLYGDAGTFFSFALDHGFGTVNCQNINELQGYVYS